MKMQYEIDDIKPNKADSNFGYCLFRTVLSPPI